MTSTFGGPTGEWAELATPDSGPLDVERLTVLSELRRQPMPVVLDTMCVRDGLNSQLTKGRMPLSLAEGQSGHARLFMEYDTMIETWHKLPLFAEQMGVPVERLRGMFVADWLP